MIPKDEPVESGPADLVRRIREGDPGAEDELVRRYRRGVVVILHRAGSDTSTAGDLSQETFRIALEKIRRGDVREPEKIAGFLCGLARNLAIESFRKTSARRISGPPDETTLASPAPGPLEDLLRAERADNVRRVLAEMPTDRDRQVLFRFYIAEEEKDDICRDLGLTSVHFNRVLFRARERYRQLFLKRSRETRKEPR